MENTKQYIVVGAGVGGLSAANQLINDEQSKVTLIEKSSQVGGRLQSISVNEFEFDIGATLLTPKFMKFLRKKFSLDIDTVDVYWDVIASAEREPLRIDRSKIAYQDAKRISGKGFFTFLWYGIKSLFKLIGWRKKSIKKLLNQIGIQKDLKVHLSSGSINAGLPSNMAAASTLKLMNFAHNFKYPVGGTSTISSSLADRFEDLGGEILLNSTVESIEDEGGEVEVRFNKNGEQEVLTADYVISCMGVNHSVDLVENSTEEVKKSKSILEEEVISTIQTTHLYYSYDGDANENYIGRAPLNNYYPLDTIEEINDYMKSTMDGENKPMGFYSHFPALCDDSLIEDGKYPITFWLISTPNPTDDEIEQFKEFVENAFTEYFLPDFKEKCEYLGVSKPVDFIKNYNSPGTTSSIAPIIDFPTFDPKLTEHIYMGGSGVEVDLASSVIQASESGYKVAKMIANK